MATDSGDMTLESEEEQERVIEPLMQETVWLQQQKFSEAEAAFVQLSLKKYVDDDVSSSEDLSSKTGSPLEQETVWLKQQHYEGAEAWFHMCEAGTADINLQSNGPGKRAKKQKGQNDEAEAKREKFEVRNYPDIASPELHEKVVSLFKTVRGLRKQLWHAEKMHKTKARNVQDILKRMTEAVEECKTRLNNQFLKNMEHITSFNSVLLEVETVVGHAYNRIESEKWGNCQTFDGYCNFMAKELAKLEINLNPLGDLSQQFYPEFPKSDFNKILGQIDKLTLKRKQAICDKFNQKKKAAAVRIRKLLAEEDEENGGATTTSKESVPDSEESLEGSGSLTSEESENDLQVNNQAKIQNKTKKKEENNAKKVVNQVAKTPAAKANRNNSNSAGSGKRQEQSGSAKSDGASSRSGSSQAGTPTPKKRNAQGAQMAHKKQAELFRFKGSSHRPDARFVHQPGLLGPRPDILKAQAAANQQAPFSFSNLSSGGQNQQRPVPNFGAVNNINALSAPAQKGFGTVNFNFSNSPHLTLPANQHGGNLMQNSSLSSMTMNSSPIPSARDNMGSQVRQSKLFQLHQNQTRAEKGHESQFGAQPQQTGFGFPLQGSAGGQGFGSSSQSSFLGGQVAGSTQHTMEHQLNELSQKIQSMQLQASQNYQLQQLMQETERLKQLLAQRQHEHHQHDRFQHQFQLLINTFLQQQQQLQTQAPQSKMARPMTFQNSQRQQRAVQNRQQQKKQKQQQNKVQQVSLGQQQSQAQLGRDGHVQKKIKQEGSSDQQLATGGNSRKQNGQDGVLQGMSSAKKNIKKNSTVTMIGTFTPHSPTDKNLAGVSSMVVLENIGCLVVVDIINSCLKLYSINGSDTSSTGLSPRLITRLGISRPFYMSRLSSDVIVVSREGMLLSLIRVSRKRLEFLQDVVTESQYYGVAYVRDRVLACAAFGDSSIDLVTIEDGMACTTHLVSQCSGPELVACLPSTGSILYLERQVSVAVQLISVSQKGQREFTVNLESSPTDVWNLATSGDKIVCCNKQTSKVKLYSKSGAFIAELVFPLGAVDKPFAMAFCDSGNLYVANDSKWDDEFDHFVTTEVNVYAFS